jgi:hypothetical protein
MLKKHGKYFADWRDASGKRHRKAFPSKRAALSYQSREANKAQAAKKAPAPARSRTSPRSTSGAATKRMPCGSSPRN